MQTATNPQTGERLYLSDEGWKPLVTATNPETGAKLWLKDGAWTPLDVPANEAEAPKETRAPRELFPPAPEGMQDTATGPQPVRSTERATPEWIRQAMDAPQIPDAAPVNPEGTMVSRELRRGSLRTASSLPTAQAASAAILAGDIGKSVQDIYAEEMARLGPNATPEMRATALQSAQVRFEAADALTEEERAAIIAQGAERLTQADALNDRAEAIPQNPKAAEAVLALQEAPDTVAGTFDAIRSNPGAFVAFLAEVGIQSAPQIVASLVAGAATRSPGIGAATMGAGTLAQEYGVSAREFLREQGIEIRTPEDAVALLNDPEMMRLASERGATRGIVIALMESLGQSIAAKQIVRGAVGNQVAQTGVQAVTGGAGETAAQLAAGQDVSPQDIIIEALAEGVTAPAEVGAAMATQAGGGQAPTAPGSGGLAGGEATGATPPRPQTEAQEMAARIAARVQREAPPKPPAPEQPAPAARETPAQPAQAAPDAAPAATQPEVQEAARAQTVSDDAAPGQASPSAGEGAAVEAGVEGTASPGRRDYTDLALAQREERIAINREYSGEQGRWDAATPEQRQAIVQRAGWTEDAASEGASVAASQWRDLDTRTQAQIVNADRIMRDEMPRPAVRRQSEATAPVEVDDLGRGTDAMREPPEPVDEGAFGPVFNSFGQDWRSAARELERRKGGEALGVLSHPEVGPVSLVWGEEGTGKGDGYGLAKIVAWHPEVLDDLQGRIASMEVVSRSANRIQLRGKTDQAGVRLDWNGEDKTWLIAAYDRGAPRRTEKSTASLGDLWGDLTPSPRRGSAKDKPKGGPAQDALVDEAQYDPLGAFAPPAANHQPLWRSIGTPPRPASDTITVAGETIKLPPLHKPIMRERIRLLAEQIMGRNVYANKVKGKTVAGYYSRDTGAIRLKRFDDLEVLAHEMAHWLDFNSTQGGAFNAWRKALPKNLKTEMGALSYTSDPGKVQSEGFAEFMRLWLTRYEAVENIAPNVLKSFNDFLKTQPAMRKNLGKLRSEMHAYYYQGALAQARGNIGTDDSVVTATRRFVNRRPSDRFRQQAVDRLHGIKIAERETTGDLNQGARSAYKLMQLANGAGSVYDAVIHEGTLTLEADGSFGIRGKGLQAIFAPLYKQGARVFDDFLVYATGRRAQELLAQGRENLFTPSQIAAMLKLEQPGFAKVFEEFQTFNAEMLDFYVQMGLITADQRAAFQEANQNYIPFHRVAERLESGKGGGDQIGKRLTGGDRNLRDIADNIVNGLHTNIRAAMVARAKAHLYRTLASNDIGGTFAVPLATDSKKVRVALDDMAKKVAEAMAEVGLGVSRNGMIVANPDAATMTEVSDIKDALAQRTDLLELWQHHQPPQTKDTFVDSVIIDGERKYFEVTDPVLIESLMAHQHRDQSIILRAMISARRFISAGITVMPPFFLPNAVRDTVNAATMSDSGFRPVIDTLRGMKAIVTQDPIYREWLRNGGGYSSLVQNTTGGKGRAALALPARNALDYAGKAMAGLESVASLFENGSRVGEYMRAIEKGASKVEATWRAREISTDFSQQPGSFGWSTFMQTVPFMNAALQGNDRLMRAFLGNDAALFSKPTAHAFLVRATNKWMISIGIFTAALWAINEDDERYQKLTPDEKSRFWHVWLPGAERSLRIPRPYGVGFIGADTVENTLDFVKTREGADTARNLAWAFPHHFWFMDYPGVLSPFIEDMRNQSFTGAPIVPVYMQDASAPYQFTESTPEMYKRLGESLNISPMRTQHYARGFFGYLETAISQTTEMMLWDEERFGERPFPQGVEDYALRQFRSSPYPVRTKYTEGYYRLRQRARTAAMDLSLAKRNATRRPDTLENLSRDETAMFLAGLDRRFRQIDRGLSEMRDAITGIKYDPNLSREEKEQQIEALYRDRDRLLTRVYADLEAAVRTVEGK